MKNPNALVSSDYGPIIINVHDIVIGRSIGTKGYWAADDIELIKKLIEAQVAKFGSVTFYDVGANIGTHTLAIAKTFGEKVTVRAFEAQRQLYYMLCGTVAINGLGNVHCHLNAVSNIHGSALEIGLFDYHASNNFGALELLPALRSDMHGVPRTGTETVQTVCLDSFEERVDFMKIDVEGMEDKVLDGALALISRSRPIVFMEVSKTDLNHVLEFFRRVGGYLAFPHGIDLVVIPVEYQLGIAGAQSLL